MGTTPTDVRELSGVRARTLADHHAQITHHLTRD
jgi:hypothetical protein